MDPQRLFALGAGAYTGGAVGTMGLLAGLVLEGPALRPATLLGIALAVAAVTGVAAAVAVTRRVTTSRVETLQDSLGSILALALPPLALVGLSITGLGVSVGPLGGIEAFWLGMVGAGTTTVGYVTLLHASGRARVERQVAESAVHVAFPDPRGTLRDHRGVLTVVVALSIVALVTMAVVTGTDWFLLLYTLPGLVSILTMWRDREVTLLDAGLLRGGNVEPWDRFEGYDVCDGTLVLERGEWWAGSYEVPLDEVENEDAVLEVLDERLG
jgi:hypothetical protein